jgi:hypothetical protein
MDVLWFSTLRHRLSNHKWTTDNTRPQCVDPEYHNIYFQLNDNPKFKLYDFLVFTAKVVLPLFEELLKQ